MDSTNDCRGCPAHPIYSPKCRDCSTIVLVRQEVKRAVLAELEECARGLDALAETEDKNQRAATTDEWRTIARSMAKAYRSGAAIIRARK